MDKIISSSRVSKSAGPLGRFTDKADKAWDSMVLCRDGPLYFSTLTGSFAETVPVGWPGSLGTSMDSDPVCLCVCLTLQCGQDASFYWLKYGERSTRGKHLCCYVLSANPAATTWHQGLLTSSSEEASPFGPSPTRRGQSRRTQSLPRHPLQLSPRVHLWGRKRLP